MTPKNVGDERQRAKLDLLGQLNSISLLHADQTDWTPASRATELAFRMQAEAPGAVDLASETEATRKLYGMDNKVTEAFGETVCSRGGLRKGRPVRSVV